MRDADLLQRAKVLHEQMEDNKVAMEPYQITPELIADLMMPMKASLMSKRISLLKEFKF